MIDHAKLKEMRDVLHIQEQSTDPKDAYMVGLYNGMELMISVYTGGEPLFKTLAQESNIDENIKSDESYPVQDNGPQKETKYFG